MKPATHSPAFVAMYPTLAEVARKHGYALAIHGTVTRDFDLIAIPWTEEAADEYFVRDELVKACGGVLGRATDGTIGTSFRPHGRISWSIHLHGALHCGKVEFTSIDLSVMRLEKIPSKDNHEWLHRMADAEDKCPSVSAGCDALMAEFVAATDEYEMRVALHEWHPTDENSLQQDSAYLNKAQIRAEIEQRLTP